MIFKDYFSCIRQSNVHFPYRSRENDYTHVLHIPLKDLRNSTQTQSSLTLYDLPIDVIPCITSFCSFKELAALEKTSRLGKELVAIPYNWKETAERENIKEHVVQTLGSLSRALYHSYVKQFLLLAKKQLSRRNITLEGLHPEQLIQKALKIKNLFELDFSSSKITNLPTFIPNPQNIRVLNLSNNYLFFVPKALKFLVNLEALDLSRNYLNKIDLPTFEFRKLWYLNLLENEIQYLSHSVCLLKNLEILRVDHNDLRELPHEIGNFNKLRILTVTHNNLQTLPSEISLCSSLSILHMHHNPLRFLPDSFSRICISILDGNIPDFVDEDSAHDWRNYSLSNDFSATVIYRYKALNHNSHMMLNALRKRLRDANPSSVIAEGNHFFLTAKT